jgi:hypothetical protein
MINCRTCRDFYANVDENHTGQKQAGQARRMEQHEKRCKKEVPKIGSPREAVYSPRINEDFKRTMECVNFTALDLLEKTNEELGGTENMIGEIKSSIGAFEMLEEVMGMPMVYYGGEEVESGEVEEAEPAAGRKRAFDGTHEEDRSEFPKRRKQNRL